MPAIVRQSMSRSLAKDLLTEYANEVTHDNPRAEIIALNAMRKR